MTVTTPRGFRAGGVAAGLKASGKSDVALVVNDGPSDVAAAVFTTNRCKANPVLWSEQVLADRSAKAVVLNSGGANCYTGSEGFQTTRASAELVAEQAGLVIGEVGAEAHDHEVEGAAPVDHVGERGEDTGDVTVAEARQHTRRDDVGVGALPPQ